MLIDKKFRFPRVWSNSELKKTAHLFTGKVCNVSGWKDQDKEGKKYREYFSNSKKYYISNYISDARGFQGDQENEFFLNLEEELDPSLINKFDVVFNHTVLEHIFEVDKAFENLCKMSKDIVIVVVPFLQEQHADYGDYWRFTPLAIKKLFEKNSKELVYINFNDSKNKSIYIYAIAANSKNNWEEIYIDKENKIHLIENYMLGTKVIKNSIFTTFFEKIKTFV